MPGVICYRTPSQDCILLGHLYRSSYDKGAGTPIYDEHESRLSPGTNSISRPTGKQTKLKTNCRLCSLAHPRPTLLSISPEIVYLILAELPGSAILNCRYVCKILKRFIDQSISLQYIIQSNARGLEPLVNSSSASLDLANLLFRERSWTMLGSIPSVSQSFVNPPVPDGLAYKWYSSYSSGKLVICHGSHAIEHMLHPCLGSEPREYEIPDLGIDNLEPVAAAEDILVYSTGSAIYVYSKLTNEVTSVLGAPHSGILGVPRVCGNWIAALYYSERRCNGVYIWDWSSGKLIKTIHDANSPALCVSFLDVTTLAVVQTDGSAYSARIDTYELGLQVPVLKSSISLPNASSNKCYARADIYTGDHSAPPGSERMVRNEGVVVIDLEMHNRSLRDPGDATRGQPFTAILVVHKSIFDVTTPNSRGPPTTPTPWADWSTSHFRVLTGVRLSPQRPVWGHRLVAVGPEPDQVSLFDFCPVGAKAVAQVWKGNGTWGVSSNGSGGVSVRAALAQRARTLVRSSTVGVAGSWFDNLKPVGDQIPYVVSVRRGVIGALDTMLDGGNIVVTLRNRSLVEHPATTRVTVFNFVP